MKRSRSHRLLPGLTVLMMLAALAACRGASASQNASITQDKLSAGLHVLAHDSTGGRLVGSQQLGAASEWIAGRFEGLGLEGAGDGGGYFQTSNDTPEHVEFEKMTRIVRLVHQTSWDVANTDGRLAIEGMGVEA